MAAEPIDDGAPEPIVQIIVLDVDDRIRRRLEREAKRQQVSVNEVAASALAAALGIPYTPTGRRYVPIRSESRMLFRVPVAVRQALRERAASQGATMSGTVKVLLAEAFGLKPPSATRRPRRRAST